MRVYTPIHIDLCEGVTRKALRRTDIECARGAIEAKPFNALHCSRLRIMREFDSAKMNFVVPWLMAVDFPWLRWPLMVEIWLDRTRSHLTLGTHNATLNTDCAERAVWCLD
jgi:hypothetical protein